LEYNLNLKLENYIIAKIFGGAKAPSYITIKIKVMGRGRPSKKIASKTTFVRTGRPASEKIVTCVVYKKPTGKKHYLNTYINFSVDTIITTRKHTPLIPEGFEIVDIGVGKSYIKRYMQQYNIKEVTTKD
jgi:hypothetical protein